jgi:hypothetical protein
MEDRADKLLRGKVESGMPNSFTEKCANCKLNCGFKKQLLEKDRDQLCIIPEQRDDAIKNNTRIIALDEPTLAGMTIDVLNAMLVIVREEVKYDPSRAHYKLAKLGELLLEAKKSYFPAVTKNMNANVNMDDEMKKFKTTWIGVLKEEKEMRKNLKKEEEERGITILNE